MSWEDATDEELTRAGGLEKYVMSQIYKAVFAGPKTESLTRRLASCRGPPHHARYAWRTQWLQERRARPRARRVMQNECVQFTGGKIAYVARSSQVLFNLLIGRAFARLEQMIFTLALYTVLRANVPQMWSNIEFIRRYRNPSVDVKVWIFFVSQGSAVGFIKTVDASMLKMTEDDFRHAYASS